MRPQSCKLLVYQPMWNGYEQTSRTWLAIIPAHIGLAIFDILVPLYAVEVLKQGLLYVGILEMVSEAAFIPASAFWGYVCDRSGRYRIFVVFPFLLLGVDVLLIPHVSNQYTLLLMYGIFSIFFAMHRPAVNLLIAELNPFTEWVQAISSYMFIRALASSTGLLLATLTSPHLPYGSLFMSIGFLYLLSFILSLFFIYEPSLKIERRIAFIDRRLDALNRSLSLLQLAEAPSYSSYVLKQVSRLRGTGFIRFLIGVSLFTCATELVFTPMPVILQKTFIDRSNVFLIFFLNSVACALAYLYIGGRLRRGVRGVKASCLSRSILMLTLIPSFSIPTPYSMILVSFVLSIIGVMWSIFDLSTNYLSVELSPSGGAGIYFSLSKLGAVAGTLLGGFIAASYGLSALLTSGCIIFITAFIAFLPIPEPRDL